MRQLTESIKNALILAVLCTVCGLGLACVIKAVFPYTFEYNGYRIYMPIVVAATGLFIWIGRAIVLSRESKNDSLDAEL